jgi:hypothetical protein
VADREFEVRAGIQDSRAAVGEDFLEFLRRDLFRARLLPGETDRRRDQQQNENYNPFEALFVCHPISPFAKSGLTLLLARGRSDARRVDCW